MMLEAHAGNVYLSREDIVNGRCPLEGENPSKELRANELVTKFIACPCQRSEGSPRDRREPSTNRTKSGRLGQARDAETIGAERRSRRSTRADHIPAERAERGKP